MVIMGFYGITWPEEGQMFGVGFGLTLGAGLLAALANMTGAAYLNIGALLVGNELRRGRNLANRPLGTGMIWAGLINLFLMLLFA